MGDGGLLDADFGENYDTHDSVEKHDDLIVNAGGHLKFRDFGACDDKFDDYQNGFYVKNAVGTADF